MNADSFRAFVLALFILAVMIGIQSAHAAISAVPSVAGYSAGSFTATAGSFSTAANAASYGASGVVNVGGKAITVPASLRMAANAGQFALSGMRLNPWAIAGTLAAGYLASQGLEYLNGQWQKADNTDPWSGYENCISGYKAGTCSVVAQDMQTRFPWGVGWQVSPGYTDRWDWLNSSGVPLGTMSASSSYSPAYVPFTDPEWDALPDPLPDVAAELPYAPYMPNGAPVESPEYDFAPFSTPIGNPYTKPDGSTAQPMAKVSPNGDSVTIDTYDQPLTDSTGAPVPPDTSPVDTVEPVPPSETDCDKYPNIIGCSEYGTPSTPDVIPTNQIAVSTGFTPVGGAGSCPADVQLSFMGQMIPWSYSPICDFATMIRPLIIGFAWLSFGFTVISGFRKAG